MSGSVRSGDLVMLFMLWRERAQKCRDEADKNIEDYGDNMVTARLCCRDETLRDCADELEAWVKQNAEICRADPTGGVESKKTANGSALASSKG